MAEGCAFRPALIFKNPALPVLKNQKASCRQIADLTANWY
jgi:hypothetical protein